MAEKRMFAKSIVLSDAFLDMPMSARCLYFTLGMLADDDGFVDGPKSVMRQCGASQDDLTILVGKRFVLLFESGVIVIKHWRINNYLRSDRYTPTNHIKEKAMIEVDTNGAYTEHFRQSADPVQSLPPSDGIPPGIPGIPPGIPSIEKVRVEKGRLEENSICSLSDDNECCTDVQRIVDTWNAIEGVPKVQKLSPDSKRGKSLGARIKEYGVDMVLEAISKIQESSFLLGKTGKFKITFDWFVLPNNFPKVLEGNYADRRPKRVFAETDIAYRAARKLGRLVSERAGVPEPKEETLQAWAGELADCVEENQTSFEDFADVMAFSQEDPFWRKTVLDAASLRKHYVKLMAEMNDGGRE